MISSAKAFRKAYAPYFGAGRLNKIVAGGKFLIPEKARGAYLYGADGKRYLDFFLESGVHNLGHKNPAVFSAFNEALQSASSGGTFYFTEAKGRLARTLAENTPPGLTVSLPAVGGGEANDLALKLAMASTGRTEVICGTRAYHGSAGLSAFLGPSHLREWVPLDPFKVQRVDLGDLENLERAIGSRTAAVVYEPARSLYDGFCPGPSYWRKVRRLCDGHGAKLIMDEVVTGMGRMGKLWGCEVDGVEPDLLVAAKGLSGGVFPVSAVVMRPEILEAWGEHPFRFYSTFGWMTGGAVAAVTAIEETRRLLPQALPRAAALEAGLRALAERFPEVVEAVNRTGLHCVLRFRSGPWNGPLFTQKMFEAGVLLHAAASIVDAPAKFFPPLCLEDGHVDECLTRAGEVLKKMAATEGFDV